MKKNLSVIVSLLLIISCVCLSLTACNKDSENDYVANEPEEEITPVDNETPTDDGLLQGKTIVTFGDSIIGNTRDISSISNYISFYCGATVYNCGFGGGRMSKHSGNYHVLPQLRNKTRR